MRVSFPVIRVGGRLWAIGPMSPGYRGALPGQRVRMTKQNHSSTPP